MKSTLRLFAMVFVVLGTACNTGPTGPHKSADEVIAMLKAGHIASVEPGLGFSGSPGAPVSATVSVNGVDVSFDSWLSADMAKDYAAISKGTFAYANWTFRTTDEKVAAQMKAALK